MIISFALFPAKYDCVIEDILKSEKHDVRMDGTCWIIDYISKEWRRWDHPRPNGSGYMTVSYRNQTIQVHRLIYRKFLGELDLLKVINHIDGNPSNNKPGNLELVTHHENNLHKFRVLKHPPVIGNKKINFQIAEKIREDRNKGLKYSELVEKYHLSKANISDIINDKIWKTDPR